MITRPEDLDNPTLLSRAEFWQRAAALAFGAWALAVPIGAMAIITSLSSFTAKFDNYILAMEKRTTLLEERQARVMLSIERLVIEMREQDQRLNRLESEKRPR